MKKGFTLIELLAVIIILAIIALIATPMVLNVIEDVKKSAAKTEALNIVDGINKYCALSEAKHQSDNSAETCSTGSYTKENIANKMVEGGNYESATVTFENGKVTSATIVSNGYTVTYNGSEYSIEKGTTPAPTPVAYYAFGKPDTSSPTNYQDVRTSSGSNTFVKLEGEQLSVCIYRNNKLECFKNNNYAEESVHLQNVFVAGRCYSLSSGVSCDDDAFDCGGNSDGDVGCYAAAGDHVCDVDADGTVICL